MLREPTTILRKVLVNELDPVSVQNRATLTSELAHQAQGDDALPRTWPTNNYDGRLGVLPVCPADRLLDNLVGDLLLVEQNELLAILDLVRRMLQ